MRKDKLKKIEAKVKLGLPITKEERAYHILYSKKLNMGVIRCSN